MLSRLVRNQLIIFTIASIVGLSLLSFKYIQAPTLLGVGRITVELELPASGGLYRFGNVTYRGVQVGKVTKVAVRNARYVVATLSLDTSARIPADLVARVLSMSAVGEQYVDLQPRNDSAPYLADGSVIGIQNTTIPQKVGPMLDQLGSLLDSIPQDRLTVLLDESFKAFNGAGYDFGSLIDSSTTVAADLREVADQTRTLIDDSEPLLNSQAQGSENIRTWIRSLAGVTDQIRANDPQVRTLLQRVPGAADEVSRLLADLKPTLPILLANLKTIGQISVTYNPSLEQLLVLLPPDIAAIQAVAPLNNPTGMAKGDFAITISDPPACTVGFLPPSSWRSPADVSDIDTPEGMYCKLPQDSPIGVRGARNYPCMEHPGKRAPTVQLCDNEQGFVPLAQRQHALGPYPLDPNLVAQGIPPDSRVDADSRIHAPVEGTPLPPPTAPSLMPSPPTAVAAPSSVATNEAGTTASGAAVHYNPRTGAYMAPDGRLYRQSNLTSSEVPTTWKDLLLGSA